jgi:hypothetical protein
MNLRLFCVVLAAASLTIVSQAAAQVSYSTTGPAGVVGWSSPATGCLIDPSSARVRYFTQFGALAVGFPPAGYGTILLRCPVQGIMNLVDPTLINGFALQFTNFPNVIGEPLPGCSLQAQLLPKAVAPGITNPDPFSAPYQGIFGGELNLTGIITAEMALSAPLNTSQTYEVDITLTRSREEAVFGTCYGAVFGVFLEELSQLQ